jgi:hypothetical protein
MPRGVPNKPAQVPGETAAAPAVDLETKTYGDGTEATGPAPLPDASPAEQSAAAPVSRRAAGLPHPDDAQGRGHDVAGLAVPRRLRQAPASLS